MKTFTQLAGVAVVGILAGCATNPQPTAAPERTALANAAFVGILNEPIRLHDGRYVGAPFVPEGASREEVQLLDIELPRGDLDGDGAEEAVLLLNRGGAGSGSFTYLAVADRGNLEAIPTQLLGDRVQVVSLAIAANELTAEVVRAGDSDAACCPGEVVRMTWHYEDGMLAAPVVGREHRVGPEEFAGAWHLVTLADKPIAQRISLTIAGTALHGNAPCNRYFGELHLGIHPGQVTIGPIGATLMACGDTDDALERTYLDALTHVQRYSFMPSQLTLDYVTTPDADGSRHTLVFDRDVAASSGD